MNRPKAKDYLIKNNQDEIIGFQYSVYIADLNLYIDELEKELKKELKDE